MSNMIELMKAVLSAADRSALPLLEKGERKRKIKSAIITTIALCKKGKNRLPVLYKADDGAIAEFETLVKGNDEGELLAVVYTPTLDDVDGDFTDRTALKKMAHRFNRDYRQIDIQHNGKVLTKEQAYIAESFIIAKGDERFANWTDYDNNPVNLENAWAVVVKLEEEVLRKAYREGQFNGVSMFGDAVVEMVSAKSADERVFERLEHDLGQNKDDAKMNPEQIAALSKAVAEAVVLAMKPTVPVVPVVKVEEAKPTVAVLEKPLFKGDVANVEDRAAFLSQMRGYELAKAIQDGKSADEVAAMFKALDEVEPSDTEVGIVKEDSKEVRTLKTKLFKAQRRSNQVSTESKEQVTVLEKELTDAMSFGSSVAAIVNARRGIPAPAKS